MDVSDAAEWLSRLMNAEFRAIGSGLFVFPYEARDIPESWAAMQDDNMRTSENSHNHEHFEIEFPGSVRERWLANFVLAKGIEAIWRERIARQFRERDVVLFVVNELMQIDEYDDESDFDGPPDRTQLELFPTIRFWTGKPEDPTRHNLLYHVLEQSVDVAFDLETLTLVPIDEALRRVEASVSK